MALFIFRVFIISSSLFFAVHCERLHEQIYSSIEGGAACFRRLNGTHQAGCSSGGNGAVGVVQMIRDVSDAQWLVHNSTAGPYMAIVDTDMFNHVIELFMERPDNVAGVLLYDNTTNSPAYFSQESKCPNEYAAANGSTCSTSSTSGTVWNERGTGLMRRNIPFPIFYLPQSRMEEILKIQQCFDKFNVDKDSHKGSPLCSVQLHSFMFAAVNSEVCMRRSASSALLTPTKVCDPLGDYNIYYSLFPRSREIKPLEFVTLVTARIDSASLFDGVSPGAATSAVGMVTLMTAATALSKMIPVSEAQSYDKNVLWTLFNGEAFDYIGSQRVAFDIDNGTWPPASPIFPEEIRLHVELGQLGGSLANAENDTTWPFHAFVPYKDEIPEITAFLEMLSSNAMSLSYESTTNLPPSSLHSFRRILGNYTVSGDLPEVLLTDYADKFTNMFYQSALDEFDKINFNYRNLTIDSNGTFLSTDFLLANGTMKTSDPQVKMARAATALARTLYQRVTEKPYSGNISASAHLVDELLYCFLRSQACRLTRAAEYGASGANDDRVPDKPMPLYVGVAAWTGAATGFAGHVLALLTGTPQPGDRAACDALSNPGFSYYWLRGWNHSGVCIQTTMNISAAVSPAFVIPDYDLTSRKYSTWTESVWQAMWARVFVSASGAGARLAACAGVAATAVAALLTLWLQRHADQVFNSSAAPDVAAAAATGILRSVNC